MAIYRRISSGENAASCNRAGMTPSAHKRHKWNGWVASMIPTVAF